MWLWPISIEDIWNGGKEDFVRSSWPYYSSHAAARSRYGETTCHMGGCFGGQDGLGHWHQRTYLFSVPLLEGQASSGDVMALDAVRIVEAVLFSASGQSRSPTSSTNSAERFHRPRALEVAQRYEIGVQASGPKTGTGYSLILREDIVHSVGSSHPRRCQTSTENSCLDNIISQCFRAI